MVNVCNEKRKTKNVEEDGKQSEARKLKLPQCDRR